MSKVREFSQYKFLYNCVGHYLETLNDDNYDYIYDLDGELVNEREATQDNVGVYVDGTERVYSIESEYVYDQND